MSSFDGLAMSAPSDGVALVAIDRPDLRNVVSDEPVLSSLTVASAFLSADPAVRAVVFTGTGSVFSAGGNVRQMSERSGWLGGTPTEIAAWYRSGIQRLIRAIFDIEVPTIAAINGPAIGAGFDVSLACDLRVAATTAKLGATFINLGLVPGDGGSWLLPRAVGLQRAAELVFTGRVIDATEALEIGAVLSIHPPDELLEAAIDLATTIAAKPRTAMLHTKRLLRGASNNFDSVLDAAAAVQAMLHGTPEHIEAASRLADAIGRQQSGRSIPR